MEFKVQGAVDEREAVLSFLRSVDAQALSAQVLDSMGWGTGGDPVEVALAILKESVERW